MAMDVWVSEEKGMDTSGMLLEALSPKGIPAVASLQQLIHPNPPTQ